MPFGCVILLTIRTTLVFTNMSVRSKNVLFVLCILCIMPPTWSRPSEPSKAHNGKPVFSIYTLPFMNSIAQQLSWLLTIEDSSNNSALLQFILENPLPFRVSLPTTYPLMKSMCHFRMPQSDLTWQGQHTPF